METVDTIFFYSHNPNGLNNYHVFSQWFKCNFIDDNNVVYNCTEQYMMAQKAILFLDKDEENKNILLRILSTDKPNVIKKLGRDIMGFSEDVWKTKRSIIVSQGNYYKFSQSDVLKQILLDTENKTLVEASPYDSIWGIGFTASDAIKVNKKEWGNNLLGKALEAVRFRLRTEDDKLDIPLF
jgi:ribA/ribD-fused uncharacterized protein